ncbi:MAG: hypothetical protein KDK71_06220 [Chlamydiia bacterium]|nr:hypothetical protein [Chlamydiia bacterium]
MASFRIFSFLFFILAALSGVAATVQWSPPTTVGSEAAGGTRETPRITSDRFGNAAAAWIQSVSSGSSDRAVFVSYYPSGGGWEPAVALESGIVSGNDVDLCIDENGNVTVAWTHSAAPSRVHSVFRPYGSNSWGAIQTVSDAGAGINTYEKISVACTALNTQAVVVWEDTTSGGEMLLTNFRSGSSSWLFPINAPVALPFPVGGGSPLDRPIVKMLANGTAQTAYLLTGFPGANDLFYSEALTPGVWSTQIPLGVDISMILFDFDTNSSGDAIAVVRNASSSQTVTRVNGTWGTPQTQTGITNPTEFWVGLDDNGLATGLWQLSGSTNSFSYNTINSASPITTTSWIPTGTTPPTISSTFTIENPLLAVSPKGNRLIVWREDSSTDPVYARLGAGAFLDPQVFLIDLNGQPIEASISDSGRGFALWTDLIGGLKLPEIAQTFDPTENLVRALGKKRLINQRTRYP